MNKIIQQVKGTRDFYPEDMRIRSWLYANIREVSELFGYQEYEAPFLEYLDLYAAKSGDELVKEQSYVFQDRSNEWITLRPELTPSLARMIAQKQRLLTFPLRWWSFGPMWRYERPQKGRSREFFQWNIDIIGMNIPQADAELASIGACFFRNVGLSAEDVKIYVNNRKLIDKQLDKINIPKTGRENYLRLIDRFEKMRIEVWENYARKEFQLSQKQIESILVMLEDEKLWQESEDLIQFFAAVNALGYQDYIVYSPRIVRGLDYYTGTVFEAHDSDGEFRAILGGGHYDNLVEDIGGDPLPGVGFAMGDVVISLVLKKFNKLPDYKDISTPFVLVTVFDDTTLEASLSLTSQIRKAGIPAICTNIPEKLGKQFRYASRINTPAVIILGPEEIAKQQVAIKDMITGEQSFYPISDAITIIKGILARKLSS